MKKTIYAILACIIVAGISITVFMGLNFSLKYRANKELDINIGQEFDNEEIKQITREVLGNNNAEVVVQKVEIYEDMASIIVEDITDEQIEALNTKINEKYGRENKVEDINIINNSKLRGRDLVYPYIWPVIISMAFVLVYACVMYRKLGVFTVIRKVLGTTICAQLVYLGIIAITRIPVTVITVPLALVIYIVTVTLVVSRLDNIEDKKEENKKTKNKKK